MVTSIFSRSPGLRGAPRALTAWRMHEEFSPSNSGEQWLVVRKVRMSGAHRLYREDWSEEKNLAVFGACANPYGHGHNYELEVSVRGPLDPETGMVVHFQSLQRMLEELVVQPLDHRHWNHDVPFLAGHLPTSENVLRLLWERLVAGFAGQPFHLVKLRLASTDKNAVEYERGGA